MFELVLTLTFIAFFVNLTFFCGVAIINLCALIFSFDFFSVPILFYLTVLFALLHKYFNYLCYKRYNKGLKLSAKQIIKFFKVLPNNWQFNISKVDISERSTTEILRITYREHQNIIPKNFIDYIIIFFFWLYKNFQEYLIKRKKYKEEDTSSTCDILKLIEKDIKKELEKSNENLNKALQENQQILERLHRETEN